MNRIKHKTVNNTTLKRKSNLSVNKKINTERSPHTHLNQRTSFNIGVNG